MQEVKRQLTTEEELFCTKYELDILSGIVNHNRLERWVPGFCSPHTHNEHESRYEWVKDFVRDKNVLDISCGTGFGTYRLAKEGKAAKVSGWDIDPPTIRYASLKNEHPRLAFEVHDAEAFDTTQEFDVIISFETIEHLKKPEAFLENINTAIASNGVCFISTPISSMQENEHPDNVYHQREWGFKRFHELVNGHLKIDDVYLQLYSAEAAYDNGFLSKTLRKVGLKTNSHPAAVEMIFPHRWDPEKLNEHSIGTKWSGYQILQCRKK